MVRLAGNNLSMRASSHIAERSDACGETATLRCWTTAANDS